MSRWLCIFENWYASTEYFSREVDIDGKNLYYFFFKSLKNFGNQLGPYCWIEEKTRNKS